MGLRTDVIEYAYECESCENVIKVRDHEPENMPPGYHLFIRRVTPARKHRISGALFFCSKDCLVDGMQFRITHLTEEVGSVKG